MIDIATRADETIADLEQQLSELVHNISTTKQSIVDIDQEQAKRSSHLEQQRAQAKQHDSQHAQAQSFAKLAQGTVREQQALTNLITFKKNIAEESKELQKLEVETAEAYKQAEAHKQELQSSLQSLLAEQERIEADITSIEQAKQQAHSDEGSERYTSALKAYQEKHFAIQILEAKLLEAKLEAQEIHVEALESLKGWPDLHRQVALLKDPDDATTRILRANIAYVELMFADASKFDARPRIASVNNSNWTKGGLCAEIAFGKEIGELLDQQERVSSGGMGTALAVGHIASWKMGMNAKLRTLKAALEEYIAYKRNK